MGKYEDLLNDLLSQPTTPDRTGTGTKRLFNEQVTYDLTEGFPLITTKRVAWKSAFAETLWFISGSTDRRDLQWFQHGEFEEDRFDIWKGNCLDRKNKDLENVRFNGYNLGNMYSWMWRKNPLENPYEGSFYINDNLNSSIEHRFPNCENHEYDVNNFIFNEIYMKYGDPINNLLTSIYDQITRSENVQKVYDANWFKSYHDFKEDMKSVLGYQEVVDRFEKSNGSAEQIVVIFNMHSNYVNRNTVSFSFDNPRDNYLDQLQNCVDLIKNEPTSRRIIMDSWNPRTTENAVLAICHPFVQFFVDGNELNMFVLIRSNDFFLGHPFNLAGYALLLEIISKECGLTAKKLTIQMVDVHLYANHVDQAKEQLSREPYEWCKIKLADGKRFDEYLLTDIEVIDYKSHENIKAEMAV